LKEQEERTEYPTVTAQKAGDSERTTLKAENRENRSKEELGIGSKVK